MIEDFSSVGVLIECTHSPWNTLAFPVKTKFKKCKNFYRMENDTRSASGKRGSDSKSTKCARSTHLF